MAATSSLGWSSPDRAPALRRAADLVEAAASGCRFPARARRLARDMRARAMDIELGEIVEDEVREFVRAIQQLGFHS